MHPKAFMSLFLTVLIGINLLFKGLKPTQIYRKLESLALRGAWPLKSWSCRRGRAPPGGLTLLSVSCGSKDSGGVEAGGVFAIPVVAAAVEDDGGNAGLGD